MKQFYFFISLLFSTFSFSQNFQDTKGELQISASGTATYTLPIAIPPSIKNVAPTINLTYSSGARGGIAGQGWSINGISAISRIATRRDIDGFVDGVDFDDNDKLALDGQRLLLKSGTYWATGSTYETEYKSNTKIEYIIQGNRAFFIVTSPDGSRSWYGSTGNGTYQNVVSATSWYIVRYEDVNANAVDYNYALVDYNNTSQLYIDNITFSGNVAAGIASQDKIKFNYENSARVEKDYIKGEPVYATKILNKIEVFANNVPFRTYLFERSSADSNGYERISKIREYNGQGEESNPVVFQYDNTDTTTTRIEKEYTNNLAFDKIDIAGDFDGDGQIDFVANNQIFTNLFKNNTGNAPVNLPFTSDARQKITATTVSNGKLNQFQSVLNAEESLNKIEFKAYNFKTNVVFLAKTINLDNTIYHDTNLDNYQYETRDDDGLSNPGYDCSEKNIRDSNTYLEGDFDGNGISEVLITRLINERYYFNYLDIYYTQGYTDYACSTSYASDGLESYILNLDPNASTTLGSSGYVKLANSSLLVGDKKIIADFNSDGKSDILVINNNGTYKIISFKQLVVSPWVELEVIGSGTLDQYSSTKQMLFGDYNGDGKTDIMLPSSEGGENQTEWNIYYANPKPAGGEFFSKETLNIVEYRPDTSKEPGDDFKTQVHFSNYYAMDINGDGKSDLVRVWRKYYKQGGPWYEPWNWKINDHGTMWRVTAFTNNIGKVDASVFTQTYDSNEFDSDSPNIPIPVTSNFKYNGANTDLVIVRGHYKQIEYYQFNKKLDTDNRLKSVSESNGNIVQTIDYLPMVASDFNNGLGNSSTDFYSSANTVSYPNIELIKSPNSYLVSKLTATINNVSKYQDFRYRGYVSNYNYGTVGFTKTTRSSWYLSPSDTKIWTTQYNDVALKGANTITWTSTDGTTVFDTTPSNLLSTKTNVFSVHAQGGGDAVYSSPAQNDIIIVDPVTLGQTYKATNSITASSQINGDLAVNYYAPQIILKPGFAVSANSNSKFSASPAAVSQSTGAPDSNKSVYNVLLTKQTVEDHLSGIKSETSFTYDGAADSNNYYGLQVRSVSKHYSGSTLQGTTTVDTEYDNNPTGAGSAYYIGRPKKVNTSSYNVASGDTRTSEEAYTYTGINLTKTEKKGHNTYAIVEDMSYDAVGNLLTKTVSAPGAPTPVASRTITDEYDASKRFVIKKTDPQNFVTDFNYNTLGQLTYSKDYMGVVSNFLYDNWGKLITTTVENTSSVPLSTTIAYAKLSDGGYSKTTTNNLGAKTVEQYDVLGRMIISSANGFTNNSMISKKVVYDGLGRKQKESEPYFSSPNLWTTYEYDYLMRPKKITAPTGKIQSLSYSGLTTTSNDDGKTTTATVDALGNKVQTTDPGGTINFKYYANGALKESDYQGNRVAINIDGWGNKVRMEDPSAGIYTYSYDAFGQLKTETTPNGTTAFVYDAAGKVTEKTINGIGTNSKTTYAYNTFNQITGSTFVDNSEAKTTTTAYEYDNLKRLTKTTETTPYATFVKEVTYDSQGKVDTETSTAMAYGKTSAKTVKNIYQNGFLWQLLDNDTQKVLWQTNTVNERGQLLTASLGNGIGITNTYDSYGYVKQMKHDITATNANVMTLNTSFEIKRGNLNSRTNSLFNRTESFKYDTLDRLTEFTNELGVQETQYYDDKGRITQNNLGIYEYDGTKTYQNKAISLFDLSYYTVRHDLKISYNTFKSPVLIEDAGIDKISFTYNDGNDRSNMFYGGLQDDKLERTYHKHYSGDGSMEVKYNKDTGVVEFVTYIGGDGYSAPLVLKSDGTTQNYLYLHRDYQGSILAITNQAGAIVEKRLFDAWGAILKVQDGAGNILNGLTVLDRGYTGHEHLESVGLIHMNGRLYDPKLHRFLQPDNFVQQPENTQNYNRYAYVLNNPLKYTDPSGEELISLGVAVIIGAVVSAATYTLTAALADVPFSIGGLAKATFIGAASAAVTFGIGEATSTITNFFVRAGVQAVAHGAFQGAMTAVSGGKFWSGFAAGAFSSIASSIWSGGDTQTTGFSQENNWAYGPKTITHAGLGAGTGDLGMIAFGTVMGGVGAKLTGGNFWQGAATGLVVSGLNHAMHQMDDNGYDEKGNKVNDKGGDTTDYMYDKDGNIISSTSVEFKGAIPSSGDLRGYGFKGFRMANGAITEDNTIFEMYAGGKALSLAGKGFNTFTGGLKQWIRVGSSYSIEGGFKTVSVRWGAGGNYWKKIGSEYLQGVNKSFRQMKISFDSWRTADPGHFHLWKK